MVTDFERRSPYISNSSDTSPIPNPIGANTTFNVITDPPNFNWRMVMGSSVVRLDILGSGDQTEVVGVNILGSVPNFPRYWRPRNSLTSDANRYSVIWDGTISTGVELPAGNYRFLYRALKIFGDQNNNSDYESWTSPVFSIEYDTVLNISSTTMMTTMMPTTTTVITTTTVTTTTMVTTTATVPTTTTVTITTTMSTTNKAQTAATYSIQLSFFLIVMCFFHIW